MRSLPDEGWEDTVGGIVLLLVQEGRCLSGRKAVNSRQRGVNVPTELVLLSPSHSYTDCGRPCLKGAA